MNDEELIIGYLENELPPTAKAAFEARLKAEPALQAELDVYATLHHGMQGMQQDEALRAEIAEAIQASEPKPKVRRFRPIYLVSAMAAAIALFLVITQLSQPKFDAAYFQSTYPGTYLSAGPDRSDGPENLAFSNGVNAYESGDFGGAVQHLQEVPDTSEYFVESQVLLGSALLQNHRPADAISPLEIAYSDPEFKEYARWLLALAWLHQGKPEGAMPFLKEISALPGITYKKTEAQEILKDLGQD